MIGRPSPCSRTSRATSRWGSRRSRSRGDESPTPLIGELTRIYWRLVDQTRAGRPDLAEARGAPSPVLAERDRFRAAKTAELHDRLRTRMAAVVPSGVTDWDPAVEERRLRRTEPAPAGGLRAS